MAIKDVYSEHLVQYVAGLVNLFMSMARWDSEIPNLRFISNPIERENLFSKENARTFASSFIRLVRIDYDFASLLYQLGPSFLLDICSGESPEYVRAPNGMEDIDTLNQLCIVALGMDLMTRTCELVTNSQGWVPIANRAYRGSQDHINYFTTHPRATVALFSTAWHGALSPHIRMSFERFGPFADMQEDPALRLAILSTTQVLLDHRTFYHQNLTNTLGDLLNETERILQTVELLCQSALYREYMEGISRHTDGNKNGEKWARYWETEVDKAAQFLQEPLWTLLIAFGHPGKTTAVDSLKGVGKYLWDRLSNQIHRPDLITVEERFAEPLQHWRTNEQMVLLVIKDIASRQSNAPAPPSRAQMSIDWNADKLQRP